MEIVNNNPTANQAQVPNPAPCAEQAPALTSAATPLEQTPQSTQRPYMTFNPPPVTGKTPIKGISFDFNKGARVVVPEGDYRVRLIDQDACLTVYDAKASNCMVTSTKVYFVNFRIEVYQKDKLVFEHNYNAKGKNVLMKFPDSALGDVLAWFPYAEEFRKKHACHLYCIINPKFADIFSKGYPEINFITDESQVKDLYASYFVGLFAPWERRDLQPLDWRMVGLQRHAAYLLGVEPVERRIKLVPSKKTRSIKEPYVCIAAQATAQSKYWNNASGWLTTVEYLKKLGYRVLCIDRDRITVNLNKGNSIPYGTEDFTGSLPLQERIDLLSHADFFIGLTSGLSWLAWGVGIPVIMIVGYTAPGTEFYTPYRVQHFHTCNSCCNDMRVPQMYGNFGYCPHHQGTDHEYECTRFITPEHANKMIDKVRADLQQKQRSK